MSFSDAPCRTGQVLHCWVLLIGQVYLNVTCRQGYTSCGCCFSLRLANVSLKNNRTSRHIFGAWNSRPPPSLLTAILAWKSAVGTMGMGPPCFPNFLSKLSCTDTTEKNRRSFLHQEADRFRTDDSLHPQSGLEPSNGLVTDRTSGPSSCPDGCFS